MTFAQFVDQFVRVRDEATRRPVPLTLYGEQRKLVEAVDALDPATGLRLYREIVVSWPRKAGKSTFAAAAGLWGLIFDPFADQREVLLLASDRDQARAAVLREAKRMVRQHPWLTAQVRIGSDRLTYTDERGVEHIFEALPNDPKGSHGRNASMTIFDEAWTHSDHTPLEGLSPSPARRSPLTWWTSYAGLASQRQSGNPWFDVLTRAQRGDDPSVFCSHLSGRSAVLAVPWITEAWLQRMQRVFAHVPAKFRRLALNEWSAGDAGSFLSAEDIQGAIDSRLTGLATTRHPDAALGLDLGLTRDTTALVATRLEPITGRVLVEHCEILRGTKAHPISLMEVEARVLALAATLGTRRLTVDRWQAAMLTERLQKAGLIVQAVTTESAWLDRAATTLHAWFTSRLIRIPPLAGLLEQLEGLEGEELRRRDRIRFTATGANRDDAPVALVLSATPFLGTAGRPEGSRIGRTLMADIRECLAEGVTGRDDVGCPIMGEGPSALPGCRRCAAYQSVEQAYTDHLAAGVPWISLPAFAVGHMTPCAFLTDRRFRSVMANLCL